MAWPVPNAWSEIPAPRLQADVPVSVSGSEFAPITITSTKDKVWEVTVGEKLTLPLIHERRGEFSGANISLKTFGDGFEKVPTFDASLTADSSETVLDLAKLKTPPGDYTIAFYGSAVAKYQYNVEAVSKAEAELKKAQVEAEAISAEVKSLTDQANQVPVEKKSAAEQAVQDAVQKKKAADAAVAAAEKRLNAATAIAKPKDIVDIVVSTPISIRVKPAEKK